MIEIKKDRNEIFVLNDVAGFIPHEPMGGYVIFNKDVELRAGKKADLGIARENYFVYNDDFFSIPCLISTYNAQESQVLEKIQGHLENVNEEVKRLSSRPFLNPEFKGAFVYVFDQVKNTHVNHLYGLVDGKLENIEYLADDLSKLPLIYPRLEKKVEEIKRKYDDFSDVQRD